MKPNEIHFLDLHRIFIGEVPGSFYIELLIRTIVVYAILMVSMRMMGKRMSAQLGRNEMAALVSLAAATGVPLLAPDRGLVPAIIVAMVIIFFQIAISRYAARNQNFEQVTQDRFSILVEDARMNVKEMTTTRISRQQLFAQLRAAGVTHLGQVKRLYLEANGSFTLIKNPDEQPGLNTLPEKDEAYSHQVHMDPLIQACYICGHTESPAVPPDSSCRYCGQKHWVKAVLLRKAYV